MAFSFEKLKEKWDADRREREEESQRVKSIILTDGKEIFARHGLKRVVLYGSYQEGRAGRRSDLDILVNEIDPETYFALARELEELTGKKVDLRTENTDPAFTKKIMERGEVIYDAQR